jgi:hypothetical protein
VIDPLLREPLGLRCCRVQIAADEIVISAHTATLSATHRSGLRSLVSQFGFGRGETPAQTEAGMLTVEDYRRIRRAHRDGLSVRAIARTLHHW